MTTQQLISPKELATFPELYETEHLEVNEKLLVARLYVPGLQWNWYIVETDGDEMCFGLVTGNTIEFGYFSLGELEALRDRDNTLRVVRDEYFEPLLVGELL